MDKISEFINILYGLPMHIRSNNTVYESMYNIKKLMNSDKLCALDLDEEIYNDISSLCTFNGDVITSNIIDDVFNRLISTVANDEFLRNQDWFISFYLYSIREMMDMLHLSDEMLGWIDRLERLNKLITSTRPNAGIPILTDLKNCQDDLSEHFIDDLRNLIGSYVGVVDRKLMMQHLVKLCQ